MKINPFKYFFILFLTCGVFTPLLNPSGIHAEDSKSTPEVKKTLNSAEVSKWISLLDSEDYQKRKEAHQNLLKAGSESIPLLEKAAHKASREAASRTLLIIEHHLQNENEKFHEPATVAMEIFLDSSNRSLMHSAIQFWNQNIVIIENRAIKKLSSLKCEITKGNSRDRFGSGMTPASAISKIIIALNWKGGEKGLKHLGRLRSLHSLTQIYCIEGNGLDLKSFQSVESKVPELKIAFRGPAFLGISCQRIDLCAVFKIEAGSTAERAGILPGDIIRKFNGKETPDFRTLTDLIAETFPGKKVNISITRNNLDYDIETVIRGWTKAENQNLPPQKKKIPIRGIKPIP